METQTMNRVVAMTLAVIALSIGCTGCMSRMIKEGMGAATGASGKVVGSDGIPDLTRYKALRIEPITTATGLQVPAQMASLLQADLAATASNRRLATEGEPVLRLSGQIVHYETGGAADTAIGPLEEVILRTTLTDAQTGQVLAQANLIGRSKATSSSGPKNLSEGVAKALDRWLKDGGLKKAGEKEKD
jgi:hypothetical protein